MDENVIIISCGIFKYEIQKLEKDGKIKVPVVYLNSMLHLNPQKLELVLDKKIKQYTNYKIILLYGDCHARMVDYEKNPRIVRSPGINCCDIMLGKEKYKELRKSGAFIVLPEWAGRWREAFVEYMGFKNQKMTKVFMNEMHKKVVYIDDGIQVVPMDTLHELADYFGLPLEFYKSSVHELETVLLKLMGEIKNEVHER